MRNLLLAAVILPVALPVQTALAQAPTWTILKQACWNISATAGQCAVKLKGTYPSLQACQKKNGGKTQTEAMTTDGRKIGQRCEMKLVDEDDDT